ncbi:DUF1684 domain-containing protein [Lentzea sp. NPDC060358]|uniref:DUF1684 domain-containing protein n=1 Tax=Lentzea sp. NPDC060358 TaxID=3347103 RepID=UPI00366168FB
MSGFAEDWQTWKTDRENALADPYGWLALVSLDWLETTPRSYDGLPGVWWQDDDAAYWQEDGKEPQRFELVQSGPGTRVAAGDVEIEIARRGGYLIRVHDPKADVLANFRGVPSYEPEEKWVLEGVYEPFDVPVPTTVGAVVEGLSHVYEAPGRVRFTHNGSEHTLTAFNGRNGDLNILFTDETSGVTTYAANRSLAAAPVGGRVVLDFNRATNLPCAFTDFATCPLPPAGNHLPFGVEAGEKIPHERS